MKTVEELAAKTRTFRPEEKASRRVTVYMTAEAAIRIGTWAHCPFAGDGEKDLVEAWDWYVGMRRRGGRPIEGTGGETESDAYKELMGGGA